MGLALHNARAVAEGWGLATPFVRTPKQGKAAAGTAALTGAGRGVWPWAESLLMLYFLAGLGAGLYYRDYGLLPFHLLLVEGHATLLWYAWRTGPVAAAPVRAGSISVVAN
jgi:hypothetical protein